MRLRDLREDHDLTQANVAKYLHCAQKTYHQYETGKRQIPLTLLKNLPHIIILLLITYLN